MSAPEEKVRARLLLEQAHLKITFAVTKLESWEKREEASDDLSDEADARYQNAGYWAKQAKKVEGLLEDLLVDIAKNSKL
jgi:hypothetical protein